MLNDVVVRGEVQSGLGFVSVAAPALRGSSLEDPPAPGVGQGGDEMAVRAVSLLLALCSRLVPLL